MSCRKRYAPKNKTFETIGKDMACPYCKREDTLVRIENQYGVTRGENRSKGIFWFKYRCTFCKAKVINFTDL